MINLLCVGRMYADFWKMSPQHDIHVDWLENTPDVIISFPYDGKLYYRNQEYDLTNYDAVCLFGKGCICKYLYDLLTPHMLVIGNPYTRGQMCDKVTSAIVMSNNGLPVIPSYYSLDMIDRYIAFKLSDDIVTKPKDGSFGKEVKLFKNKSFKFCKGQIAQKYIDCNASDERWIIVDGKIIMVVKRTSADENDFRANISLGAKTELLEITEEKKEFAKRVFDCFPGCVWTGIDVMYDSEGHPYVCEVNYFPQHETDLEYFTRLSGHNFYEDIYEYIVKVVNNHKFGN